MPAKPKPAAPDVAMRQLLHELQVHQIELEMQNDELRRSELALEAERARYLDLYELAPVGYCTTTAGGLILQANLTAAALLGTPRADLSGQTLLHFVVSEDAEQFAALCQRLAATQQTQRCDLRMRNAGDKRLWVHLEASLAPAADGPPLLRIVLNDISELRQADETARDAAALARATLDAVSDHICVVDSDGTIVAVNLAWRDFGRANGLAWAEGGIGRNYLAVCSLATEDARESAQRVAEGIRRVSDGSQREFSLEYSCPSPQGLRWFVVRAMRFHADAAGAVVMHQDITAIKENAQRLEHAAHFDTLTDLPNRTLVADRLNQAILRSRRNGTALGVAYLDLDGFKGINDEHGHSAGDAFLVALARRMQGVLRAGDTLARFGGDEFVAVLADLAQPDEIEPLLDRLLAAAAQPVRVGPALLQASASVGAALHPQDGADADLLLRHADHAMYQAKQAGRNRWQLFDAAMDVSLRAQREGLDRMREALAAREFVLYYQPKVHMRSGAVVGAEALIRWLHPQRGLLPPGDFLPAVEDQPLGVELGDWVLGEAVRQQALWGGLGLRLPVSVNVGALQLMQRDFVARLQALLAAHPEVPAPDLQIEILETSALADTARAAETLLGCQRIGVTCALDDFGTGYSSLTYLQRLPIVMLKIDQSFVRNLMAAANDRAIVTGVIGLARAFGREIIAEGVESVEAGVELLRLGCELAQGSAIAGPMPAAELPAWLAHWRTHAAWAAAPTASR